MEVAGRQRIHTNRSERAVRDLPWSEFRNTVHIEVYRVKCSDSSVKVEKVLLLPGRAPFSKRFEDAMAHACESALARQVARRFGLAESTLRAIDLGYLERWDARRRDPPPRRMGVDKIYRGKSDKFLTIVCNLETREPHWQRSPPFRKLADMLIDHLDGILNFAEPKRRSEWSRP